MSAYRPVRMSGLGAHVAGAPAFIITTLLGRAEVEDRLRNVPQEIRLATMDTLDDIRGAGLVWDAERKGRGPGGAPQPGPADDGPEPPESFLSTSQAAEALQVSERRVRQLVAAEALRGRKVGRCWQVEVGSVQARLLAEDVSEASAN